MSAPEQVGLGVTSDPIVNPTPSLLSAIWKQMTMKITEPQKFLPVINVSSEDKGTFIQRSMQFNGEGPAKGNIIEENIYQKFDGEVGEIRFVVLKDGKETDVEIINALHKDPARIEYFQRSVTTGERIHWDVPKPLVLKAITKSIEDAKKEA